MKSKYFAITCNCSIEVRRTQDNERIGAVTRGFCPRCYEQVKIQFFENICTPGYSDYEGEYLYKGGEE